MTISGRICLYNEKDEMVEMRKFFRVEQRRNIIHQWSKIYTGMNYYYHIDLRSPYTEYYNEKTRLEDKEPPKEKIVRPPSTYSNTTPFGIAGK